MSPIIFTIHSVFFTCWFACFPQLCVLPHSDLGCINTSTTTPDTHYKSTSHTLLKHTLLKHFTFQLNKGNFHCQRKDGIFSCSSLHYCWCWLNWDSLLQLRTNSVVLRERPFRITTSNLPVLRNKTIVSDLPRFRHPAIQSSPWPRNKV